MSKQMLGESVIVSPKQNQVFQVDLAAMMVIDCKAVMTSETDEVFWLSGESFVEEDDNLPVFYNYSWVKGAIGMEMTTSLIFKKVSEDDLSRNYTCKLQSDHQLSTFVTIILTPKVSDVSVSLIICIVGIIVVVFITTAVAFSKFKIDVVLFLRDALGCYGTPTDGKKYDACLMFYKSNSDVDLGKADRKWMKRVLEERFGYSLCLLSRDTSENTGAGACSLTPGIVYVREGEIVALSCDEPGDGDPVTLWKKDSEQKTYAQSNMSAAQQRQMGIVVHKNWLVILNTSMNHQGNYTCQSCRNESSQSLFTLMVYSVYEDKYDYPKNCYKDQSCTLSCPEANIPSAGILNITDLTWYKDSRPLKPYFQRVQEEDAGIYTCNRSYLYSGQTYNITFVVPLIVKTEIHPIYATITSPRNNQVFSVELGTTVVIDCVADSDSSEDLLFWMRGQSFVDENSTFPVFYNETRDKQQMKASLVIGKVSQEDLSTNYTCKLDSDNQPSISVTIFLTQKAYFSYLNLIVCVVSIVVAMTVTIVVYLKFQKEIKLFLRDTLSCYGTSSDEKSYDAFLMCYKCDTDEGLHEADRTLLENTLEEKFGYSLCLCERDVLPGEAAAEAVLACIEQSRTVILVPTSQYPGPESSLLSAIHAALVEKQTRLIFINTKHTETQKSGSFPEALQLLSEMAECVTWKGRPPSSSFWKKLRLHLPAPQRTKQTSTFLRENHYDSMC
ncbi:interleukin-18 receptor 1 isoform X2 [Oryzias latipes]|uniref:interleukin-18 receptor 1 isoform X2 n=1 Tax=Oryzias latipes TaxID=8090 RepID=UPI0009D96803|nr:interleukin-18 receptor 1 isoform X2 [Oryzias latipes]